MPDFPPVLTPNNDMPADPFGPGFTVEDVEDIASQFKKGWKTTEFWVTVATAVGVTLNSVADLGLDVGSIATMVGANASYVLGRSYLKTRRVNALASTSPTEVTHYMQQ